MAAGYVTHWANIALRLGDTLDFAFASLIGGAWKIAEAPAPGVELGDRAGQVRPGFEAGARRDDRRVRR
jgi:hypothetical protein